MKTYKKGDVVSLTGDYVLGTEVTLAPGVVAVIVEAFLGGALAKVR